jgi:cell division protein FtsZ
MFELVDSAPQSAIIKVLGIGGGGGNAVQHMLKKQVEGVDFGVVEGCHEGSKYVGSTPGAVTVGEFQSLNQDLFIHGD